jgi:hypothetical protein
MPIDYVRRVRQLDWQGLRVLWRGIEAGSAGDWPAGRALEHLVLRAFELSGATVRWPYSVRVADEIVEQIDGAVHVHGLSCILECKDLAKPVTIEAIARLRNQLLRRPAGTTGLLFSRSGFTEPGMMLAGFLAPQTILLWTGGEIAYLLQREDFASALVAKYRRSVEDGLAGYNIRLEMSL